MWLPRKRKLSVEKLSPEKNEFNEIRFDTSRHSLSRLNKFFLCGLVFFILFYFIYFLFFYFFDIKELFYIFIIYNLCFMIDFLIPPRIEICDEKTLTSQ